MSGTLIYALHDPRDPTHARYVGRTRRNLTSRLQEHQRSATHPTARDWNTYKAKWLRELLREERSPVITLLEVVPCEQETDAEDAWILALRAEGHRLTNLSYNGGDVDPNIAERVLRARSRPRDARSREAASRRLTEVWRDPAYRAAVAARKYSRTSCVHGHLYDAANTYYSPDGARHCRKCNVRSVVKSKQRRRRNEPLPTRTHCVRGHEYTQENRAVRPNGTYYCKTCNRDRVRGSHAAQRRGEESL